MKELWTEIEGYKGYYVSTEGRIWSMKKRRLLKGYPNYRGYLRVCLTDEEGNIHFVSIHRLVAEAFIPNPNNLETVDHIAEGNKTDNRVVNLQWLSRGDNVRKYFQERKRNA